MASKIKLILASIVVLLVIYFVGYNGFWKWGICRQYCDNGNSILLTKKTGEVQKEQNRYATPDEQGVIEKMKGPGRHFFNPFTYTTNEVSDVKVNPGEIRLVMNKLGDTLPQGRFIADDPNQKGTQRKVLTPGLWRINPYGQEVSGPLQATVIRPGYVGVQTLLEGDNKGILDTVLTPGIYHINPRLLKVEELGIGYTEWTTLTEYTMVEEKQEDGKVVVVEKPKEGTGINFPLSDGKQMFLDITLIWGIAPKNAPKIIKNYGTFEMVQSKIIEPQVTSICKNRGSNFTTMGFIRSETRNKFQAQITEDMIAMGKEKDLEILIVLVRKFHPDRQIQETIQATLLAEEQKETFRIEQQRDKITAELEKSRQMVTIVKEDFDAETSALVEGEREMGNKTAAEIRENANKVVANALKRKADIDAEAVKIDGQAKADVIEANRKAIAEGYRMSIAAYGSAEIFNLSTFAEKLPEDFSINYRYAGPGTLWTDPGSDLQSLASKKILEDK